jgi:hypothetical protein
MRSVAPTNRMTLEVHCSGGIPPWRIEEAYFATLHERIVSRYRLIFGIGALHWCFCYSFDSRIILLVMGVSNHVGTGSASPVTIGRSTFGPGVGVWASEEWYVRIMRRFALPSNRILRTV